MTGRRKEIVGVVRLPLVVMMSVAGGFGFEHTRPVSI